MLRSMRVYLSLSIVLVPALLLNPAWSATPVLFTQPAYESPVRADPDDLLLLSGSALSAADTVVYQAIADATLVPAHPTSIPSSSSAALGVLTVVNAADAPHAIAVHLSQAMTTGQTYAIWVTTPAGEWSAPALINDARPLWITPDVGWKSASRANLPRVLKVVGRNLQPGPGASTVTRVRLVGVNTGTSYVLTAHNTNNDFANTTAELERYVAAVDLPSSMVVDNYTVAVSRDMSSWIPLLGNGQTAAQLFAVSPDPVAPPTFSVSDPRFADPLTGNICQPNDGIDDTGCIILAIRAAQLAGGGTVTFGSGTWLMSQAGTWGGQAYSNRTGYQAGLCPGHAQTCGVSYFGVLVPVGVNLQGAGATGTSATIIEHAVTWPAKMPLFTLQGNNTVSGFDFTDDNNYLTNYANQTFGGNQLQLGVAWYFAHLWDANDPLTTSNVIITNNLFDKPWIAIGTGSLPADHIAITYNSFGGAFNTGIYVGQDENNVRNLAANASLPYQGYHWNDTIVAGNTFYPSSFQVTAAAYDSGAAGGNGSIAGGFNTGLRTDFSDNIADGTSTQYFYSPNDPKGFRAAFFWSVGASQEMTLVSNNVISCPGDKYGDGEAIVYDGGSTHGGTPTAEPVIGTSSWIDPQGIAGSSLTALGPLATLFSYSGGTVDITSNPTPYYQGFWLQVVSGTGQGQWRKIESLSVGSSANGPTFTANVTPAFDVLPDVTSQVVVARGYWQNVTVNNYVEQRKPQCTRTNARDHGGTISWYASTADSAMEGNLQYGTSGILLKHTYQPQQPGTSPVGPGRFALQSYNEVRNNVVSGAYDWSSAGMAGGIQLTFGATEYYCSGNTCPAPIPTNTGFGVTIAGNTISQASGRDADGSVHPPIGAIGINPGWTTGRLDSLGLTMWMLSDNTLIFRNTMQDISNTVTGSAGGAPLVGIGIDVAQGSTPNPPVNWRTTLYRNSCSNVDVPVSDFGLSTTRYCPSGNDGSCECAVPVNDHLALTATGSPSSGNAGDVVTYTIMVTNSDFSKNASDVTLAATPSIGAQINGASYAPSQGTCDPDVNICMLGSIPAGTSATVTVTATLSASGTWPVTFTVSHRESETHSAVRDSVVMTAVH